MFPFIYEVTDLFVGTRAVFFHGIDVNGLFNNSFHQIVYVAGINSHFIFTDMPGFGDIVGLKKWNNRVMYSNRFIF